MPVPPSKKIPAARVLAVARELDTQDLEAVIKDLLALRAQRQGATLPREELLLLEKINKSLKPEQLQRFEYLRRKGHREDINDTEQQELIDLTTQIEKFDAQRLKHLIKLAQLRRVSLREVMDQIGLRNQTHG